MSYRRLHDLGRGHFPPEQTMRSIKLYHRQVYRYAFHRPKLELLRESAEHARFAPVASPLNLLLPASSNVDASAGDGSKSHIPIDRPMIILGLAFAASWMV